jgi:flagellar motor switch protein FliM
MTQNASALPNDILSKAEVDALFEGLGGETGVRGELALFDWQSLPHLSRANGGAPSALEVVNQRLLRNLKSALPTLLGRHPEVSVQTLSSQRYGDFLDRTAVPSGCAVFKLRPLVGHGLLVVDLALADVLVDLLHGGSGKAQGAPDARSLASIGLRTVQRLLGVVMVACTEAWHGVADLNFEMDRIETEVRHAHIATLLERVHVSVFTVQVGEVVGTLTICLPLSLLGPIRDVVQSPSWGDFVHADNRWLPLLTREVQAVVVPLTAHCRPLETTLAKLMALRAGDFLALGDQPQTLATPDGLPLFEGQLKSRGGRQAIQIDRVLTADADAPGGPV